jgi:hypothetical protein
MHKIAYLAALTIVAVGVAEGSVNAQVCGQGLDLTRPVCLGSPGSNIKMLQTNSQGDITGCCTGTLGSMVQGHGSKYILSNNHVLARVNLGKNGEGIIEPGCPLSDPTSDIVAHLSSAAKISFAEKGKNQIDAAIARIVAGDVSSDILNIGPISNKVETAVINLPVQKMGATSGLTHGVVTDVGFDASGPNGGVQYSDECNSASGTANFVDQIVVKSSAGFFAEPGDSGSLVVTTDACPRPVGLLFASDNSGNIYLNPIGKVLSHFGVSFVAGCTASNSAAKSSASESTLDDGSAGSADAEDEAAAFASISGISIDAINYARGVKGQYEKDLFAMPGVTGIGIGASGEPGVPRIDVYVTEDNPSLRNAMPDSLEGIPVNVIIGGPIHAL